MPAIRSEGVTAIQRLLLWRRSHRIVGTSTSCTHTLKAEYHEMLDLDDDDGRATATPTKHPVEILAAAYAAADQAGAGGVTVEVR